MRSFIPRHDSFYRGRSGGQDPLSQMIQREYNCFWIWPLGVPGPEATIWHKDIAKGKIPNPGYGCLLPLELLTLLREDLKIYIILY